MDKQEILRYMRANGAESGEISTLAEWAMGEIERVAQPKTYYEIFDCAVEGGEVCIGQTRFLSQRLSSLLKGCKRVVLFGATLSFACDRAISATLLTDSARAMALQGAAACKVEEVCDSLEREIAQTHAVSLTQRFSPGYYDLPLSDQSKFFSLLPLQKIGVTLMQTYQMLPLKSVTAFIGIKDET